MAAGHDAAANSLKLGSHKAPRVATANYNPGDELILYDRDEEDACKKPAAVLGLTPKTVWIVLIPNVLALAAIAAGVRGGLAARSKKAQSHSPPSLIKPPATISSPASRISTTSASSANASPKGLAAAACNASDTTVFTPLNVVSLHYTINGTTLSYKIYCNTNLADNTSGKTPDIHMLQLIPYLPSLGDCITACATYNVVLANSKSGPSCDLMCSGIVYQNSPTSPPAKCYMNAGVRSNATAVSYPGQQEIDSAVLVWNE